MLSRLHAAWIASSTLVLGTGAWLVVQRQQLPLLEASPPTAWVDSDGDFLPDALEWVVLSSPDDPDSDDDDVGDFLEAAQRSFPTSKESAPLDHEVRAVVTVTGGPNSRVWLHLLFRFVGDDMTAITTLAPFADWWGYRFGIDDLLGRGQTDVATKDAGADGLFVRASLEICSEAELRPLLPCTLGAIAVMGGRQVSTGVYLDAHDGSITTLVGVDPSAGVLQTLVPGSQGNPFWTARRVCLMRLAVIATAPGGAMAQVTSATCVSDGKLACPPTCTSASGQIMFFPDGLSTVTGGGVPTH